MKTFLHFVLVTVATLGFSYGLYLLFLQIATSYKREDREDEKNHPSDFC